MANSTIQPQQVMYCGDYPNGTSINSVRNGFYRVIPQAKPSEGVPSGFEYCMLLRFAGASGYLMAILTDIYGRLAVWSTQNSAWQTH